MAAFEELGVNPSIIRAIEEMGWALPTPIQHECVPLILTGGDVLAAAETGSGKTGAFALPSLQAAHEHMIQRLHKRETHTDNMEVDKVNTNENRDDVEHLDVGMNIDDRDAMFAIATDRQADITSCGEPVRLPKQKNNLCQARVPSQWCTGRATHGVSSGKVYFNVEVKDEGLVRIGYAAGNSIGELGKDKQSYGYGGTGP